MTSPGGPREETSLFGFLNILLKYRGMVATFMLIFGGFGIARFLESMPRYTTRIGINIESRGRPEASGLAAQLGAATGGGNIAQDIAFFTELLRSPAVLRRVATGPFSAVTKNGSVSGHLARFYGHEGPPESFREEMTEILRNNISIASSARTGNLWIFVSAPYPELAQQIATALVNQLDEYRRQRKRSQAESEREFVEQRLAEARAELQAAEERVVEFNLNNRQFASPVLSMSRARLQREVGMKQQLYTTLLQSYDAARIDEARSLPAITLLESPERPLKPERSTAASTPLLGAITGLLIAIVIAFIRERMAETAAAPTPAFDDYSELKRQALRDLRNPLRPFGRVLKPRPGHPGDMTSS